VRTVRRWRSANSGLVYEEETEVTHMNAGSGGKRTPEELTPAADKGNAGGAPAAAAAAARRGGGVFWTRGGGGFTWDWRRRR
jgi:hypothetical protein